MRTSTHDARSGAPDTRPDPGDRHPTTHTEHDLHAGHDPKAFEHAFWISLALTVPVVLWADMVQEWFGYTAPTFPGSGLIPPVFGTVIFIYGGKPFLIGAYRELRRRQPGMMMLISMAITVAFGASVASTFGWFDLEFWWELAALITVMLLGHWQEMKAIGQARGALHALAELLPDDAERVTGDGRVEHVGTGDLRVGDVVLVRPGGRVPADGEVLEGTAELDESMITGESKPVTRSRGDTVIAGTISTDSSIRVRVTAVGDDTALAGIQRLVLQAQQSKSRAQTLADRFAAALFYIATGAGLATFVAWATLGHPDSAVLHAVTVLVIACPHALGLAIPLVISLSTALAARHGILVKDRLALERMRTVDLVLFDKTGTLTAGRHVVTGMVAAPGHREREVIALAAAVERDSEHPLARAIVAAARAQGEPPAATDFRATTGRGVQARVKGVEIAVGGPALLGARGLAEPSWLRSTTAGWRERGASVLYVLSGNDVIGALSLEDQIRPEAHQAVSELHRLGIHVAMITGDAREVAHAVAKQIGIDEVFADVLPEDKDSKVAELQRRGYQVAMVGDGVNDAPALARADVGIAIGAGTDVAIESAGVVLAASDPRAVLSVIRLSRASYRKMIENLAWAAGYNVVTIPLAAGTFVWAGLSLSPAAGAVLMSASTIVVALNAQLLRRVDLMPVDVRRPTKEGDSSR
ncbi:heavy metal translocating P-type ATPase [Rhabdothermincola sp.]|uniref:heavy metal translocating P-type ATPase n=1 Tax=Rhabdothermincola sp. TaxID=2820405 RepID=UPI002FE3836D